MHKKNKIIKRKKPICINLFMETPLKVTLKKPKLLFSFPNSIEEHFCKNYACNYDKEIISMKVIKDLL